MKTLKSIIFSVAVLSLVACNDEFLDCAPQDKMNDANFWKTEAQLVSVTYSFTDSMTGKDWLNRTELMGDCAPWAVTTAYRTIGGGNLTTETSQVNSLWRDAYTNIGRTNYFLNNYQRATTVKPEVRERFAAEAIFYRTFNYWLLTSYFGDVPYIDKELNIKSPEVYRGRDPRAEVIEHITTDLEEYYKALPEFIPAASAEFGHISQCTALVLLSRIYLYNGMWEKAANAAERAMQNSYYELYSTGHPEKDYMDIFNYTGRASRNSANKEILLSYIYNYELGESARTSHNLSRECWVPNDYARFVPTKTIIETYLNADGTIWNPADCESYEQVFEGRDPRMCQSILTPGTIWEGGDCGDLGREEGADKKIFTYPKLTNTKEGSMTYSGYYMRKYVETSIVPYQGHDDNDIVIFRYAEALLNYAEAKCMLGTLTQADIDNTINKLRDRVGMVRMNIADLPAGSDILTEIRRERTVELFFEGHRYFDIIRWRIGELLGQDLVGVNRRWLDQSRLSTDLNTLKWKNINGEQYLIIETGRQFRADKHYLLPVPFKQSQLNPNLLPNNPGWN